MSHPPPPPPPGADRNGAFFQQMKQDKIDKEREEQQKLRERIANMTEEEKQQYEADKIEAAIQDKKKGKHLKLNILEKLFFNYAIHENLMI